MIFHAAAGLSLIALSTCVSVATAVCFALIA
ncbi:MAG: hypothetical protein AVDCRST_MAG08-4095 [uncultured Acetobacteraceae bacterium]|uniref:Uncharacterized protein n=1 Tax=uncultured Acetobacteraceae bacterium TaxID=169975 RepID=A0A6J4JQJ1_9PROT|nr:MAG: hypothetical protein AVDCRST_MAG08-4095 [uncultured Acetobacteraceae bacterium]